MQTFAIEMQTFAFVKLGTIRQKLATVFAKVGDNRQHYALNSSESGAIIHPYPPFFQMQTFAFVKTVLFFAKQYRIPVRQIARGNREWIF